MTASLISEIANRFVNFADETRGSSSLYSALSPKIASDQELLELLLVAPPTQQRANLLFAAVHDLLLSGLDHTASRYYPSVAEEVVSPDEAVFDAFRDLCLSHRSRLRETIAARHTQTNEVRRSIAFLPVFQKISAEEPIALVEVGASAGLNLLVDRYRYRYGDGEWIGRSDSSVAIQCEVHGIAPPVQQEVPQISFRIGLDSHPLDVRETEDARWLMACVWPEQIDRLQLLRSAMDVARLNPPRIVSGNAIDTLEETIGEVPDELPICLFHSATLFYFTDVELTAFVSILNRLGHQRRLHWLSFEGGAFQTFGVNLPFSRLYSPRPDDRPTDIFGLLGYARWTEHERQDRLLARADMHGRWIEWTAEG